MVLSISPENVTRLSIMKAKLRHLINRLRAIDRLLPSRMKEREIDHFFQEISKLEIDIDSRSSGVIKYREFGIADKEEGFEVSVVIVQTSFDDLIIIDADFGEED